MATISSIRGHLLELTVVGCTNLYDTEWLTKQDPYVCLEYGGAKMRTRVCKYGGKNPTFQNKFTITLINGYTEIDITVWNRNRMTPDEFISGGKASLQKAITQGFDDSSWSLQARKGRHGGEVKLIMHYKNPAKIHAAGPSDAAHMPHLHPQVAAAYPPPPVRAYPHHIFPRPGAAYGTYAYPSVYPPSVYPPSVYPPSAAHQYPPYPGNQGTQSPF